MTARLTSTRTTRRRYARGRTLIELLIALVLSLLIIGAVGSLYYFSSSSSRTAAQLGSAEERGRLAMFFLGEPIAMAGFGNISGSDWTRFENVSMREPHIRICANGRFADALNDDFTCVAGPGPGDQLYVSYHADSDPSRVSQGTLTDCLGALPPVINGVRTVRNIYSIEQTAGGALEFGCTGNGGGGRQELVRDVENFKVFLAFDSFNYQLGLDSGSASSTVVGSRLMTPAQVAALPGADLPADSIGNPWNSVVGVYVCVQLRTSEAGTTPEAASRFRPCPQNEQEAATGAAEVVVNDGVARRTFTQVYTIRARAQAAF